MKRVGLAALLALLASVGTALADGPGEIRLADAPVGGYRLTVATSPSPLEVGDALVSVLVQDDRRMPVLDATVSVQAAPAGTPLGEPVLARPGTIANRLLYAATIRIDRPGAWVLFVRVDGERGGGEVTLELTAQPAGPLRIAGPALLVALPSLIVLAGFAARQLRRKRAIGNDVVPS